MEVPDVEKLDASAHAANAFVRNRIVVRWEDEEQHVGFVSVPRPEFVRFLREAISQLSSQEIERIVEVRAVPLRRSPDAV